MFFEVTLIVRAILTPKATAMLNVTYLTEKNYFVSCLTAFAAFGPAVHKFLASIKIKECQLKSLPFLNRLFF
jgi:hypothetical protein